MQDLFSETEPDTNPKDETFGLDCPSFGAVESITKRKEFANTTRHT
jgi:hypothetical protein